MNTRWQYLATKWKFDWQNLKIRFRRHSVLRKSSPYFERRRVRKFRKNSLNSIVHACIVAGPTGHVRWWPSSFVLFDRFAFITTGYGFPWWKRKADKDTETRTVQAPNNGHDYQIITIIPNFFFITTKSGQWQVVHTHIHTHTQLRQHTRKNVSVNRYR